MRVNVFLRGVVATAVGALLYLLPLAVGAQEIVVQPYVQPGDGRFLTGTDVKVISWMTEQRPGEFIVEYQTQGGMVRIAKPARVAFDFAAVKSKKQGKKDKTDQKKDGQDNEEKRPQAPDIDQHYFKYTAYLDGLPFNSDVRYSVKLGDRVIREAAFRTRSTADKPARCVLVGDLAQGRPEQKMIAYQIGLQKPEFLMALGDIVYQTGTMTEYMDHFWTTYNNVPQAGPKLGAPLMASVPFYPVMGNHDMTAKLPGVPDAFAVYYFFCPPKGGPGEGPWAVPLGKDEAAAARFRALTADSYPNLDAYSFDTGAAHFTVFNVNKGVDITDHGFRSWLLKDLKSTKAKWKFVCYHVPAFHSSFNHYGEQQCRLLQPIFEEGGVDVAFAGHVHNYQRSVPLTFLPDPIQKKGTAVNGKFSLDKEFDGVKNTKAKGVIHIVAGGGGASLYGPGLDQTASKLIEQYGNNFADYTARMVADMQSFVVLDIAPDRLGLKSFNQDGKELDSITITK